MKQYHLVMNIATQLLKSATCTAIFCMTTNISSW